MADKYIYKIGRRKTAIATVRLFDTAGQSTVNDKNLHDILKGDVEMAQVMVPFTVLDLDAKKFYFTAKVNGGGSSAQIGAIVLGLSRALAELNPDYKKPLKSAGLMTRDPRMVERKKTGLRKARKREQYSKR